jgi:CubicO group peptidase (beta-lactamase class C family)
MLKSIAALLALSLLLVGCDSSPNQPQPVLLDLTQPWPEATPAKVGLNKALIANGVQKAAQIPRFLSLLVVRNGQLAVEEYFHGNHADSLNDVRSVTKSVLSTLVGAAIAAGFISSLEETLGDHLPPDVANLDSTQQSISIRDLLTMSGGFLWDESGGFGSYNTWIRSDDHIQHLLDQPSAFNPGSSFTYNSAAVHLLGVLLQEAVGMPLAKFADQFLFIKIGISARDWEELTRGYVNGGSGIDLRPRNLARLGQFYLQGGKSGDTQLLPENWVEMATAPNFSWRSTYGPLRSFTYGYLWWIQEGQANTAFLAWGFGGQFIYVVPELELVVVATTDWRLLSQEGGPGSLEQAVLDVIVNDIVPAAR